MGIQDSRLSFCEFNIDTDRCLQFSQYKATLVHRSTLAQTRHVCSITQTSYTIPRIRSGSKCTENHCTLMSTGSSTYRCCMPLSVELILTLSSLL